MFKELVIALMVMSSAEANSHHKNSNLAEKVMKKEVKSHHQHLKKSMIKRLEAAKEKGTKKNIDTSEQRKLGAGQNGVSYIVVKDYGSDSSCGTTPMYIEAEPLLDSMKPKVDAWRRGDCFSLSGTSAKSIGCSNNLVNSLFYYNEDCSGTPAYDYTWYLYDYCRYDYDFESYVTESCDYQWPFKNMSGILVSSFEDPNECQENRYASYYEHIPLHNCYDGLKVQSCENNIGKTRQYDSDSCNGMYEQFVEHYEPNSYEMCNNIGDDDDNRRKLTHDEYDDDEDDDDDEFFSVKCSNNHLYKP